jgi:hypothetical protein
MGALSYTYDYQKPENTYTLEQFIACQSDSNFCYNNLSFIDQIDNIKYNIYNVSSDYIDEIINNYCKTVTLSDNDLVRYKYRPKLLCYDIYGSQELYPLILVINDICSVKDFTKRKLILPTKENMSIITKAIMNANRSDIQKYNADNIKTSAELKEKNKTNITRW